MTSEKQMRYVTIIGDYESDKSLDKKISEINIGDAVAFPNDF
jgi:hypothetical protein